MTTFNLTTIRWVNRYYELIQAMFPQEEFFLEHRILFDEPPDQEIAMRFEAHHIHKLIESEVRDRKGFGEIVYSVGD